MALAVASAAPAVLTLGASVASPLSGRKAVSLKAASLNKAFGIKSSHSRVTCMAAVYKVTIQSPSGDQVFECKDDVFILDQAEKEGFDLPYSCRNGSCSSCVGKIVSGEVDQDDQSFLDPEQEVHGFVLTCVAYPASDLVIVSHQEDALY